MRQNYIAGMALFFAACAHNTQSGPVRFSNQPPVLAVNDRLDIPTPPRTREFFRLLNAFDSLWVDAVTGSLELRDRVRALNVNAVDEVPDSTWFRNRIGAREISEDEIRLGPGKGLDPGPRLPLTIVSSKVGGTAPGFIIRDGLGQKYLLKFDFHVTPEMDTGAHVITQRILWACGYNVPNDHIVYFERDQLTLSESAVVKDAFGAKRPMSQGFVEAQLNRVGADTGRPIRALLSRYIDGIPVGGFSSSGTRADDPNDTIPHQHRRELRGLQPIAAWLGHTDIKEGNTIDAWASDPEDPTRHYIVHYWIDFGKALGTMAYSEQWKAYAFAHALDWGWLSRSMLSFGFWPRPWDGIKSTGPAQIGLFESDKYDPRWFRTNLPYPPFTAMDRFDGFWGAKLLMRFSREQLEAIVKEAKYSDPRAAKYVVDTLVARQRKTARHWFKKVAPLDKFRMTEGNLCFDDLMLQYALEGDPHSVNYRVRSYDYKGKLLAPAQSLAGARSPCVTGLGAGPSQEGYTILRIDRDSRHRSSPPVFVHLALGPQAAELRIIGLWRE